MGASGSRFRRKSCMTANPSTTTRSTPSKLSLRKSSRRSHTSQQAGQALRRFARKIHDKQSLKPPPPLRGNDRMTTATKAKSPRTIVSTKWTDKGTETMLATSAGKQLENVRDLCCKLETV